MASGVRRIEAITGRAVLEKLDQLNRNIASVAEVLKTTPKELLHKAKDLTGVIYLYTAKEDAQGNYIYLVDGLPSDSADFRHIGGRDDALLVPGFAYGQFDPEPRAVAVFLSPQGRHFGSGIAFNHKGIPRYYAEAEAGLAGLVPVVDGAVWGAAGRVAGLAAFLSGAGAADLASDFASPEASLPAPVSAAEAPAPVSPEASCGASWEISAEASSLSAWCEPYSVTYQPPPFRMNVVWEMMRGEDSPQVGQGCVEASSSDFSHSSKFLRQ